MKKTLMIIACLSLISLSACWYPQNASKDYSYRDTTFYYVEPTPNPPPGPVAIIEPVHVDSPHPSNHESHDNNNKPSGEDNAYQSSQRDLGDRDVKVNRDKKSDSNTQAGSPVEQKPASREDNTSETSARNSGGRNR